MNATILMDLNFLSSFMQIFYHILITTNISKCFFFCTLSNFQIHQKPIFWGEESNVDFHCRKCIKNIHYQNQQQKMFLTERPQSANANFHYLLAVISSPESYICPYCSYLNVNKWDLPAFFVYLMYFLSLSVSSAFSG